MICNTMFVSWAGPVRGRETIAPRVFGEWVEMLGAWKTKGNITNFTPCFLTPHGTNLGGFFLIEGNPDTLMNLFDSEECMRAIARGQYIAEDFRVTRGFTGEQVGKQMELFRKTTEELSK